VIGRENPIDPSLNLPAAVCGGLIRDLPDPVDSEQIVEVDPAIRRVCDGVEAEMDRGSISDLSDRDESANDAGARPRSPSLEAVRDQVFMKDAGGIDVENPGVFLEGLPEFTGIVFVEAIYV
jgi:hypothetical protein